MRLRHLTPSSLLLLALLAACAQPQTPPVAAPAPAKVNHAAHMPEAQPTEPLLRRLRTDSMLTEKLEHKVSLDSLLCAITHPEKIKVWTNLEECWIDSCQYYTYSDGNYLFTIQHQPSDAERLPTGKTTLLQDGQHTTNFADFRVTCHNKNNCIDYGFNQENTFEKASVIDVCGKRFLYATLGYRCNGNGCGSVMTMVYDMQTKHPTFIENYRIDFDGFFLSDFNNDNNPDLLVIEKSHRKELTRYETSAHDLTLYAYTYQNGKFVPSRQKGNSQPYQYVLYGIGDDGSALHKTYSLKQNSWYR